MTAPTPDPSEPPAEPAARRLVVNADDLGLSVGVTAGILEAHARGIVTSASLMVLPAAAADAVTRSREYPDLSLGLHLDLGEWAFRNGAWSPLYEVAPLGDERAVGDATRRQVDAFLRLTGSIPTHLDSHQHVHLREPLRSVALRLAEDLAVPLRHLDPRVRYCGRFYGQTEDGSPLPGAISVEALVAILAQIPAGTTELACHPGHAQDLDTMYREERSAELGALCDPRVRAALEVQGIELLSFAGLFSERSR